MKKAGHNLQCMSMDLILEVKYFFNNQLSKNWVFTK